jgi:hypothetical protein
MRLVKNIFIGLIALIIAFIAFMPKEQLYYFAERKLSEQNIVISQEEINTKFGALIVKHGVVNFQGIDVAQFNKAKILPLLFVNRATIENIEFLNIAKNFINFDIEALKLNHTILKPFIINLTAFGGFGSAEGFIDLKKRLIRIDITEAKNINSIKRFLKKGDKGWYYESRF